MNAKEQGRYYTPERRTKSGEKSCIPEQDVLDSFVINSKQLIRFSEECVMNNIDSWNVAEFVREWMKTNLKRSHEH